MSVDPRRLLPGWFAPVIGTLVELLDGSNTPTIREQLAGRGPHRPGGPDVVPSTVTAVGFDPLPPVDETPNKPPCPPNQVRDQFGGCSFIPSVYDPDTGESRYCITDDECENPERHRKCPAGQFWNGTRCAPPWSPNPFVGLVVGAARESFKRLAQSFLGDFGPPAPKRAPGPSRRRTPRRRPPPKQRPPARPSRPAPGRKLPPRVVPGPIIPGLPADMPSFSINPIDFIIREWQLYTRPLGERRNNPRRGGSRTRGTTFPRMPPVVLPGPQPIPVEIPRVVPRVPTVRSQTRNAGAVSPVPSPPPSPARAPAARPVASPFANPLFALAGLLPGLVSAPPRARIAPRARQPLQRQLTDPINAPIGDPLTPIKAQQVGFATVAEPTNDPCAVRVRDARRRQRAKRKQCKKFTTKTIRVCADKRS